VAWDNSHKSSAGYGAKAIFLNRLEGDDFGEQIEAAAVNAQIDSPRLITDPRGGLHLLWCQQGRGGWQVWHRTVGARGLGKAAALPVKSKNPRYPSGCFDSKGRLWVVYTDVGDKKWTVLAERIGGR
jgi:hypothetical protein